MRYKIFDLSSANNLLSELRPLLQNIAQKKQEMVSMHEELLTMELICADQKIDYESNEGKEYIHHASSLEDLIVSFEEDLKKINGFGCILRDIDDGVIDFYYAHNNELIFLNWVYTEETIEYWHDIDTSFRERNPLSALNCEKEGS